MTHQTDTTFTFINVFEIPVAEIKQFVTEWEQRSKFITGAQGFISAELHESIGDDDRFKLINVSKFASRAEFEAATTDPTYREELETYQQAPTSTWVANRGFYRTAAKFDAQQ